MHPPKPHAVESDPGDSVPLGERELIACRRAFESGGSVSALQDALLICAEQDRRLPLWLTCAIVSTLEGRASPPGRDVVDYVRYLAVCEGRRLGLAWDRAYQYAVDYLSPVDEAKGGDETMRVSYKRPARGLRDAPGRYFVEPGGSARLTRYQPDPDHAVAVLQRFLKK